MTDTAAARAERYSIEPCDMHFNKVLLKIIDGGKVIGGFVNMNKRDAIAELVQLANRGAAMQWVSVDEMLPDEGQDVLAFLDGTYFPATRLDGAWLLNLYPSDAEPSHWMLLPTPPEGTTHER